MRDEKEASSRRILRALLLAVLLPILLVLLPALLLLHFLHRLGLHILVCLLWLPRGKDVLFVYSDSPVWHEYMTSQVLPLVGKRAIVLDWSERKKWSSWSLPVQVLHSLGGDRAFNPLVILFRPLRPAKVFRFWWAFKDYKRGHLDPVERLCRELSAAL